MIAGPAQKRILVVDDETGPRESVRFVFKNNYEVLCAASVDQAVERLTETSADAVIMDIKMPGKSGIDGLKEIRSIDPDVSVIMLTGFGSLKTAQQAIRLGANDYIEKPFDTAQMRRLVDEYVERTQVARARANALRDLGNLTSKLKAELVQKEHMAALGEASAQFVHDLNSPLTVICGYVELLMDDLKKATARTEENSGEALHYLDHIAKHVRRCHEMARMWADLGKRDPTRMKPCHLSELIQDVADTARALAHDIRATVVLVPSDDDCVIHADSVQLVRAFQNVVQNAIQALPRQDGVVRIKGFREDREAVLMVEDNGCGIDPDKIDRVFEQHFTTKKKSGGMGIGLFITKKVIEETHGGSIRLANRPDGGVAATIRLPLYEAVEANPAAPTAQMADVLVSN